MTRRILLITPATAYTTGAYLRAAKRLNLDPHLACDFPLALELLNPGHSLRLDLTQPENAVQAIVAYARKVPLTALIGLDEHCCIVAAKAEQALGLAHNPPCALVTAHDKYLFRQSLATTTLACPGFQCFGPDMDINAAATRLRYPVVLKPLRLSASRGVIRANNAAQFISSWQRLRSLLDSIAGCTPQILAEDYIPGIEVALEGIIENGRLHMLALFDKPQSLQGPFFEESIYVTPSQLPVLQQQKVIATVATMCTHLGLIKGPIHAELRLNNEGIWFIEMAARSIGGRCASALGFGNGTRLEELVLRNALGQNVSHLPAEPGASGVMMIPIPAAGRLRALRGLDQARSAPGITAVNIDITLGSDLLPLPEGDRYLGFIFARGADPQAVIHSLQRAHSMLRFEIDNAG